MKSRAIETSWARFVIENPGSVIMGCVAMVVVLSLGLVNATMSSDYRYFFGEDNPQRQAFESLQKVYSKDDSVLLTLTPEDGVVFKTDTVRALRYLTDAAWKLPFVTRVDSVSNFQHSYAEGDDLVVKDLIALEDVIDDPSHMRQLQSIALNEPNLKDRLLNADASVTGINIKMMFPGDSPFEVPAAAEAARELAKELERRYPGHKTHLTGMVMLNDAFNEAGIRDVTTLMPAMYLLISIMLLVLLRTKTGVAATLGVMIMSILGAMGFSGWAGIPITPPSSIAPTVIMTLAIAHSIHFLKAMLRARSEGADQADSIIESVRQNLRPIFLTSLTTIIGFLSLNFSDTPPFHDLGNITAVGVALSFVLSVGFLPAVMSRAHTTVPSRRVGAASLANRYARWVQCNRFGVITVMLIFSVVLGSQIRDMRINDQFVGYFDDTITFRPDSEYTIENLTGVYDLNFDIRSPAGSVADPHYLAVLDRFADYVRTIPGVVHVSSISDTFKKLNMNMHGDEPSEYRLPQGREMAAQYLLLYEMSLPYGLDLNSQINVDKSGARVVVTLTEVPTSRILEISDAAAAWLRANAPSEMYAEATSPTVMFSHITERNVFAMLWGTAIALTLITIVMSIALRSIRYGLLSLVPNVIPATMAIGLWAFFVGEAGFSIAFVASVTLGIIVDDTVHFLSKFNYAKKGGRSTDEAIVYALSHVGAALITTSVILVLGFSILMLSGFKLNFVLGALSALTIAVALVVDFTLLPALLGVSRQFSTTKEGTQKMKYAAYCLIATAITAAVIYSAPTLANVEQGRQIAIAADEYDQGFENQTAAVTMILRNSHGESAERDLRIKILEVADDGDQSLTIFDTPLDVKGTSFLSYSHAVEPDEQWLYLPSLKRVKRISSNNKSGPFMGSEFAYEDLSSQEVDKYTYAYVNTATVLGEAGHVIERKPVDPNSGYTRQRLWVDGTHFRTAKIEFYDRKDDLLKTLTYDNYQLYGNGKWRAGTMDMENHQTGKSTTLIWKDIVFGVDLSPRDFDRNALKRVR